MSNQKITIGFGIGNLIAAIISYVKWHSIGWAILHCVCGWFYVIYYIIRYELGLI